MKEPLKVDLNVVDAGIVGLAHAYQIAEVWHGVYVKPPDNPSLVFSPADNVRVANVTSGIGMTMSFAFAGQNLKKLGAIQ
jgi:hypothetical protein